MAKSVQFWPGKQDEELMAAFQKYKEATGAPDSEIVRRALRAAFLGDKEATSHIRSFLKPRALHAASHRRERSSA
jgi:hypothetical protein